MGELLGEDPEDLETVQRLLEQAKDGFYPAELHDKEVRRDRELSVEDDDEESDQEEFNEEEYEEQLGFFTKENVPEVVSERWPLFEARRDEQLLWQGRRAMEKQFVKDVIKECCWHWHPETFDENFDQDYPKIKMGMSHGLSEKKMVEFIIQEGERYADKSVFYMYSYERVPE